MNIEIISQEFGDGLGVPKRICPFAQSPLEDCLVTNMESRHVEEIIYYCGGNFEQCEIYKRALAQQQGKISAAD